MAALSLVPGADASTVLSCRACCRASIDVVRGADIISGKQAVDELEESPDRRRRQAEGGELLGAVTEPPHGLRERVDETLHRGRRRVHLVRDTGHEHAQAGHLLGVDELTLGLAELAERPFDLGVRLFELRGARAHPGLEHLGERAHLGIEPRVLDRGRGLIGEGHEQAEIGLSEGRLAEAADHDHADHPLLEGERRRDDRTGETRPLRVCP